MDKFYREEMGFLPWKRMACRKPQDICVFKKGGVILGFLLFVTCSVLSQKPDTNDIPFEEKGKKGWSWGGLPVLGYDADMGFQFGLFGQVFYYGDGSTYPEYRHTLYGEVSWYTKGSAVYQLFYDSKYLIPGGIRVTADISYLTEKALDFYGFNGYEANYIRSVEETGSDDYISRMFYRMERRMLRLVADFQGNLPVRNLRWLAGVNFFSIETATVDVARINRGKKEEKKLPDTALLYDHYVDFGLIGAQEKSGGNLLFLKLGLIYDSRDQEAAPGKGIWSEILLLNAPTIFGNNPYAFVKLAITHRQYITLVKNRLVCAYRLGYQGTIAGQAPYYILPYMYSSWSFTTKPDGLGGAKTLRGIRRNRVVGDGMAFGNIELRWKVIQGRLFKQSYYLGLTGFIDGGMVVQDHKVYRDLVPEAEQSFYFNKSHDSMHWSAGLGIRAALNENFIISIDYGWAFDPQDGSSGLYLGVGNIF